jgi:hypothetical protein
MAAKLSPALEALFSGQCAAIYVSVDKPVYKRGEIVRIRGVCADAYERTPLKQACQSGVVSIRGPKVRSPRFCRLSNHGER